MFVEVTLPKLGSRVKSGVIVKWLKEEGTLIEKGESIAEVETEKSTVEIAAPICGILQKIFVLEEEVFTADRPIALIEAKLNFES